nr:tetratricopeptide repeat protein [Paenibacillus xylanexedens]
MDSNSNLVNIQEKHLSMYNTNYVNEFNGVTDDNFSHRFYRYHEIIKKYCHEILIQSKKFSSYSTVIDTSILMMDRILMMLEEESKHELVDLLNNMSKYTKFNGLNEQESYENLPQLFLLVEKWLVKIFNLKSDQSSYKDINIIFDEMLDIVNKEEDYIYSILNGAKTTVRDINSGQINKLTLKSVYGLLSESIFSLVFPVIINIDLFKDKCRNLDLQGDISDDVNDLLNTIKNEYKYTDDAILGRESEVLAVLESAKENGLTILKGKKGSGKSGIFSRVLNELDEVIPKLLYSFKYSVNILDFIRTIVEQSNNLIINKIDTHLLKIYADENSLVGRNSDNILNVQSFEIFRIYFNESIRRVIEECGLVYIFIDSLESLDQDISFLFRDITEMCKLVITCAEEKSDILSFIESRNIISIENFTREAMPQLTKLDDNLKDENVLNNIIYKKTKGDPTIISNFLKATHNVRITTELIEAFIVEDKTIYAEELAPLEENQIIEELLLILSVFEPIQTITIDYIQRFLHFNKINYRLPRIRKEIGRLSKFISDIRFNRIKLLDSAFANYLKNKYFSLKDISDFETKLFDWMANDYNLRLDFICEFIKSYQRENLKNHVIDEILNRFIQSHEETSNSTRLFRIGYLLFNDSGSYENIGIIFLEKSYEMNDNSAASFLGYIYAFGIKVKEDMVKAEKYLKKGISNNDTESKTLFSELLINGQKVSKNVEEGKKLLEEAVSEGSETARLRLAIRLLSGKGYEQDLEKADELFNELIEKNNTTALRIMGNRYLYGHGLIRNIEEGKRLLNLAIEKGSELAKYYLARYMIVVSFNEQSDGLLYLNELIKEGHIESKRYLSSLLIDGKKIPRDVEKGLDLLHELVQINDNESVLIYAEHLFKGKILTQDIHKAKELITKLNEKKYPDSFSTLGDLLIEGIYYEKNIPEGIEMLIKGAQLGDTDAYRKLALRYGYGKDVHLDLVKSVEYFSEAIELGNNHAKYQYAKLILEDNNLTEERKKFSIKLLEEAGKSGSNNALSYLGEIYTDGDKVESNVELGLEYFKAAIASSYPIAMRELGHRLIFGLSVPKDSKEGRELLERAIGLGDKLSKTILGHAIIIEDEFNDIDYGIDLLKKSSEEEPNASRILGEMMIRGSNIEKNKVEGEQLLRNALLKGDIQAQRLLSKFLIEGLYLDKNLTEGLSLLEDLVEKEDETATIRLARFLIEGKYTDKNTEKGMKMLLDLSQRSMEAKCDYAYYLVTGMYGVIKNIKIGTDMLRELEEKNYEDARRLLAKLIIDETIKPISQDEGIKLLEKAVDNNDYLSMELLGELYLDGLRVGRDHQKALQLFEQSINGNIIETKYRYALRLLTDDIVEQNVERGMEILEGLNPLGLIDTRYSLAVHYLEGDRRYLDVEKGFRMLEELVEDGVNQAKFYLARVKIYGFHNRKDVEAGIAILEQLLELEHQDSMHFYSDLLIEGVFIKRNISKGEKILKSLAQKGSDEANYKLAKRYLNGDGLRRHISTGINRLEKAARHGHTAAMIEYGIRLKRGIKIGKDELKGKEQIQKAIKKSDSSDLHLTGIVAYQLGDYELSSQLLQKSIEGGYAPAGTALAYILRRDELKLDEPQSIYNLLQKDLCNDSHTAILNLVLLWVRGSSNDFDWQRADLLLCNLGDCSMSMNWWLDIALLNDKEGHLILGWLSKHNKIRDPNNMNFKDRLLKAKSREFRVPEWLFEEKREESLLLSI